MHSLRHCLRRRHNYRIGIVILIRIGIGGVGGIQIGGQYLPLQVTIQGGLHEVVGGGEGVFYYKKEEDKYEEIMDKEAVGLPVDDHVHKLSG